jgi:hypothetical protein
VNEFFDSLVDGEKSVDNLHRRLYSSVQMGGEL